MIKKSAQTFSTASWKKSWDQHETFRFIWQFLSGGHRNKYSLTLKKEFNCISQLYGSSLFYIIRWSDFQANGLQIVQLRAETVLQYSTWMLSDRRDHSIDVSDNICSCLCGFSLQMPFQIINFLQRFRQCFKLFYIFEKKLFMDFLEFPKYYSRKTAWGSLSLLMLQWDIFRTQ